MKLVRRVAVIPILALLVVAAGVAGALFWLADRIDPPRLAL